MSTESDPSLRNGDLVIHVPADGSRGFGPLYLDDANSYGSDADRAAVACLVNGPASWVYGLPKSELLAVGNAGVQRAERAGNGFTLAALRRMAPAIRAARAEFYRMFPTFEDGRESVPVSEIKWPMRGFISDEIAASLATSAEDDMVLVDGGFVAYATPRPCHELQVEQTAIRRPEATVMLAYGPETDDGGSRTFGYFAVPSE